MRIWHLNICRTWNTCLMPSSYSGKGDRWHYTSTSCCSAHALKGGEVAPVWVPEQTEGCHCICRQNNICPRASEMGLILWGVLSADRPGHLQEMASQELWLKIQPAGQCLRHEGIISQYPQKSAGIGYTNQVQLTVQQSLGNSGEAGPRPGQEAKSRRQGKMKCQAQYSYVIAQAMAKDMGIIAIMLQCLSINAAPELTSGWRTHIRLATAVLHRFSVFMALRSSLHSCTISKETMNTSISYPARWY